MLYFGFQSKKQYLNNILTTFTTIFKQVHMFKIYDHTFDWVHILIIVACVSQY